MSFFKAIFITSDTKWSSIWSLTSNFMSIGLVFRPGCQLKVLLKTWYLLFRCSGTTKWVHQACIQRWVDEKQKGNTTLSVECPQCGTAYVIRFPRPTFVVSILDSGDMLIQKLCPIITGGVCVGSIYWTMVTFGAVTFMQTVGHDRSLVIMERADPMLLLVSLPLVPVGLIIGQMIRWEETVSTVKSAI